MNHFAHLTPEQRALYAERSRAARRSPELKRAYANAEKLREEHKHISTKHIAQKWGIKERTARLIITGK